MTYTVTVPILWSTAIELLIGLIVVLIIYWLWRLVLGLIS